MEDKIIEFYYKWDRLEKPNGVDIVDFNLLQKQDNFPGEFHSRQEVKEALLQLIDQYKAFPQKNHFIEAKLTAALYYLNALMGERVDFYEYVEKTMGVRPKYVPEEILQKQLEKVKDLYKEVGYGYSKEEFERFKKENTLSKEEIERDFVKARDIYLPKILAWLNLDIDLQYETQFVNLDVYWMNWTSTDAKGNILLRFNTHPRNAWLRGFPETLAMHEVCGHAIQASSWKQEMHNGNIPISAGLTNVFSPESFTCEGIGDTLSWFYPEQLFSSFGQLAANARNLHVLTLNNAHIMINEGKGKNEIKEYLDTYMPGFEKDETRDKTLDEARNDPLLRTYFYVYGISSYYLVQLAEKLNDEEKKEFVIANYQNILTPQEIIQGHHLQ